MKNKLIGEKKIWIAVLLVVFVSLILKLAYIWKFSVPFTYDQGRDLLEVRRMWVLKRPTLIGPTTSLHGVFCGPFWYWLILPFFVLTKGSPLSSVGPLLIISFLMPLLFFILMKDKKAGLAFALVFSLSRPFFISATHALNSYPMVYLVPLILLLTSKFLIEERKAYFFWSLFLLGSGFHFNVVVAAFLMVGLIFVYLFLGKAKLVWKNKKAILGFILPFLPQLFFDFRHDFIQLRTILKLFSGDKGSITTSGLSLWPRFISRIPIWWGNFLSTCSGSRLLAIAFILFIFLALGKIVLRRKPLRNDENITLFLVSFIVSLSVYLCLALAPFEIWPWYLSSIGATIVTLVICSIVVLSNFGPVWVSFFSLTVIWWLFSEMQVYLPFPLVKIFSSDQSNLATRISVVDSVYSDAGGVGMNIYTFAANVYDYPYQYLVWWRAERKFGYLPQEYVYLPSQPEYFSAKAEADALIPKKEAKFTYLLIEPFESQEKWYFMWRGNFGEAIKNWQIGRTKIEKLLLNNENRL